MLGILGFQRRDGRTQTTPLGAFRQLEIPLEVARRRQMRRRFDDLRLLITEHMNVADDLVFPEHLAVQVVEPEADPKHDGRCDDDRSHAGMGRRWGPSGELSLPLSRYRCAKKPMRFTLAPRSPCADRGYAEKSAMRHNPADPPYSLFGWSDILDNGRNSNPLFRTPFARSVPKSRRRSTLCGVARCGLQRRRLDRAFRNAGTGWIGSRGPGHGNARPAGKAGMRTSPPSVADGPLHSIG